MLINRVSSPCPVVFSIFYKVLVFTGAVSVNVVDDVYNYLRIVELADVCPSGKICEALTGIFRRYG